MRTFLFVTLSLFSAQQIVGSFGYSSSKTVWLSILALSILFFFLRPIISVVSLPTRGSVFLLISFISTSIVLYVLGNILPDLTFEPTTLESLNIAGFMLPSKELSSLAAMIFSAFIVSFVYLFLEWLCRRK